MPTNATILAKTAENFGVRRLWLEMIVNNKCSCGCTETKLIYENELVLIVCVKCAGIHSKSWF